MADAPRSYCETTDLYLQLLSDAQRMEDRRMARMVLQKLSSCGAAPVHGQPGPDIIPFPGSHRHQAGAVQPDLFWQDRFFWENLVQFLILLVAGGTWLTLPFILAAMIAKG